MVARGAKNTRRNIVYSAPVQYTIPLFFNIVDTLDEI